MSPWLWTVVSDLGPLWIANIGGFSSTRDKQHDGDDDDDDDDDDAGAT